MGLALWLSKLSHCLRGQHPTLECWFKSPAALLLIQPSLGCLPKQPRACPKDLASTLSQTQFLSLLSLLLIWPNQP